MNFGLLYFIMFITCTVTGTGIGTWIAVTRWGDDNVWGNDWTHAGERIGGYTLIGFTVGMVWPLGIPALLVAGPAYYVRNKREQAEYEREATAAALREAASLYPRGSEEWNLLRRVANETATQ